MGRLVLVSLAVLLGATACGTATPMRNVLVYVKPVGDGSSASPIETQIWVAAPNGAHARLLTEGDQPAVSPDGRYVAFIANANRTDKVRVMPTGGGAARTVGGGSPGELVWAPNSRFLAFTDFDRNLTLVVDIENGKRLRTLASSDFAFSPDSQHMVYTGAGLWVVPTHGGTPVQLTDGLGDSSPVWGKPGIAFFRGDPTISGDVWLMSPRGGDARQLTHTDVGAMPFALSADGKKLLAYYPPTHDGRLWAVEVPSGRTRALTRWQGIFPIGLSRNGASVLAIAGCIDTLGTLETIPFAGGKPHVIVNGPCSASWNAR